MERAQNMGDRFVPHNPVLAQYMQLYHSIQQEFMEEVASLGLGFADEKTPEHQQALQAQIARLTQGGLKCENSGRSLWDGWISPSCVQCRRGMHTLTLGISTQCPKKCYFCFNANQQNDEQLKCEILDVSAQLKDYFDKGVLLTDIALTGGEPLVHKPETKRFFETAAELYPGAYTRLYTSGAYLDEAYLGVLAQTGLDEIRFSVKLEEPAGAIEQLLDLMELAKRYIRHVVVEMPVAPDQIEQMKWLLRELDARGIQGINLLEFCYPLANAAEFVRRGYLLKNPPYKVLYDYTYAGGLPVDGSEEACVSLLEFAQAEGLSLGVHYCSLENKFTSQLYLQNASFAEKFPLYALSDENCFMVAAKVYGQDAHKVAEVFHAARMSAYEWFKDAGFLTFPLAAVALLAEEFPEMELALSLAVIEGDSAADAQLREVGVVPMTAAVCAAR